MSRLPAAPLVESRWKRPFRARLLAWFRRHARILPWRCTRDPYAIWVSEIMLQQTQVATVVPYFERFLRAFPDVGSLAEADEEQVLRIWEGLGYYRRARQLHQAAQIIVSRHGGCFPRDPLVARGLPGIGRYTAGAILSIAHDAREPILEANTLRLYSRLLAYRGDPRGRAGQHLLWSLAADLLPQRGCGLFNQALMELGSTICRPQTPACEVCPVAAFCLTRERGWQKSIPTPPKKTQYETVHEVAVVVWRRGAVLLRQCQSQERWSGLWDFPRFELPDVHETGLATQIQQSLLERTGVTATLGRHLDTFCYGVTRFRITLQCYEADYVRGRPLPGQQRWVTPSAFPQLPLSVTGRRITRLVQHASQT